jgi:hypothetical protein
MGKLGPYLRSAREAMGIDVRDAAHQTRISVNFLIALEEEDFSRLPGEVFVKGFLKNYGRFLGLDEDEVMKRYAELKPEAAIPSADEAKKERPSTIFEQVKVRETPLEPLAWGAAIVISLIILLVTSRPANKHTDSSPLDVSAPTGTLQGMPQVQAARPDKLYLEVIALEDTWLLVRTDDSPQKKAVLKKGESLIWSADSTFLLSYGDVRAVKLLLNGEELEVKGTKGTPVRDITITRAGIKNQQLEAKKPRHEQSKPKQQQQETLQQQPKPQHEPQPLPQPLVQPDPLPSQTFQ